MGAAAWSLTSLAPHGLVQLLIRRRHLLDGRQVALERATASLARKQTEIEEFTYTVAHDLNAPLSAISMTADLLLDEHLPDPARADVTRILRLAGGTENMIVDLLGMVRIVSEPEPVETVDLGAVTAQALDVLHPHIAARQVRVDVTTPLPAIPGAGDQAAPRGRQPDRECDPVRAGRDGALGVTATREGASVVLSVRDNGVGIPSEYHDTIFEMFRRVPDGNGGGAGSGMGLAIVKRIVETHGGKVWVDSAPGAGSVFRVRLPAG